MKTFKRQEIAIKNSSSITTIEFYSIISTLHTASPPMLCSHLRYLQQQQHQRPSDTFNECLRAISSIYHFPQVPRLEIQR